MSQVGLMERLVEIGAIKEGHFLLASGRHSAQYIEKFDLLRNPVATSELCESFASRFAHEGIDIVAGPTTGGILLAFEVARQMKTVAVYAERVGDGTDAREFKRGTVFAPESRVLVVDDVLTTGGSIRETLAALALQPVDVIGIGVLVDRSGGAVQFDGVPLFPLLTVDVQTWSAAECPLCAAGSNVTKPGTTAAKH